MGKKKKLKEIPCIYCGEKFPIDSDFNQSTVMNCPHCLKSFEFNADNFQKSIQKILDESVELMKKNDEKNSLDSVFDRTKKRLDSI